MSHKQTTRFIKSMQRRIRKHVALAHRFYIEAEELILFEGFNAKPPTLYTTEHGEIMVTYMDVDFTLSEFYPCIEQNGTITRDYIESLIRNQLTL